jgi:D-xylose transport system substrate-binding protein
LALASVWASIGAAAAPPAAASQPVVSFLLASMEADRYQIDRDAFIAQVESQGARVLFASAGGNDDRQEEQLRLHLDAGARVVVLQAVDVMRGARLVRLAHERGAKVIAYDRLVAAPSIDLYVTHDHVELGRQQALALLAAMAPHASAPVLICMGASDSQVSRDISRGNVEALAAAGFTNVVKVAHAGWSMDECEATTLRWLHHGGVAAVFANNSRMALGAAEAIEASRASGSIPIAGGDMTLESCRALRQGRLQFDAFKPIASLAERAAAAALDLAAGVAVRASARVDGVPTLMLPVFPLRRDLPKAELDAARANGAEALLTACGA